MSEVWDAEFRPRAVPRAGIAVAALIAVCGLVLAALNDRSSGAFMRTADQVAWGGLAVILAAAIVAVLTRPRLRVGPSGLAVRNVLDDRLIPWPDVVDIYFPRGKRWPRVELQAHEYVPVLAIHSADGDRAVAAMDTLRELMARYRNPAG
ncbi:MAG: PH domain-containing protein [Mycobacterium sp.]|nr:PH domain-containing protein [Mycobacterium sp.]